MSRPVIVATTSLPALGGRQPVFAEAAISESRWVCSVLTGIDELDAGRRIFSDLANASANEPNSGIDSHARTLQTLSRHHRHPQQLRTRDKPVTWLSRARRPWSLPSFCPGGVAFA
jgi:hypothetical protein